MSGINNQSAFAHDNLILVESLSAEIYNRDRFFVDKDSERVMMEYYNPDSVCGGQLVLCYIPFSVISAAPQTPPGEFFDSLEENSTQELIDLDVEEFQAALEEFLGDCDFLYHWDNEAEKLEAMSLLISLLNCTP